MTSGQWITMQQFAAALASAAPCDVRFNESNKVQWPELLFVRVLDLILLLLLVLVLLLLVVVMVVVVVVLLLRNACPQAPPREHPVPHNLLSRDIWRPSITLEEGVRKVWLDMRDMQQPQQQQQHEL